LPTNGHMPGSEVLLDKCEGEALAIAMGPHPRGAADLERIDLYVEEWVEVLPAGHRGHFDVPAAEQSSAPHCTELEVDQLSATTTAGR